MTIRKILVPLSGRHAADDPQSVDVPALSAAFSLAQKFEAKLEALCVTQARNTKDTVWDDWIPDYGMDELLDAIERQEDARNRQAKESYDKVQGNVEGTPKPKASFVEQVGAVGETVGAFGRLSDLIVVASSETTWNARSRPILDAAFRRTARPVFVAPLNIDTADCATVALAWNNTAAAARAVAGAMPFLQAAKKVNILCCDEGDEYLMDDYAEGLVAYLKLHGVSAKVNRFVGHGGWQSPEAIVNKAVELESDLLVLGCVIHRRALNLLYGSLTETVLESPRLPTLLVP